jgi:predicted N-acetyltransferase YhbS
MADGPRALRADEWPSLNELVSTVFRPTMFESYPQLFNEENREHLRVVAEDGKIVCHVGMTQRSATLAGCAVEVACIGAVATDEAYRGRGFASAAFQDCCDLAAAAGVDLMLISGGRGLYTRVGCRRVGAYWDYVLDAVPGSAASASEGAGDYALAPLAAEHLPAVAGLYQAEPVRFLRPPEDWARAFACRVVMAGKSDFWGLWAGETLVAYVIAHPPRTPRPEGAPAIVRVVEYAGDRVAVASALPRLLARYEAEHLRLPVADGDAALRAHLRRAGSEGMPGTAWGTLRVINFPQLMERCRPLLAERLGGRPARALRFSADAPPGSAAGGFTIRLGDAALRIPDLGALASYLFARPGEEHEQVTGPAALKTLLAGALPLPALWYGITYV